MKKIIAFAILIVMLLVSTGDATASGGQQHGDEGQGAVHQHCEISPCPWED